MKKYILSFTLIALIGASLQAQVPKDLQKYRLKKVAKNTFVGKWGEIYKRGRFTHGWVVDSVTKDTTFFDAYKPKSNGRSAVAPFVIPQIVNDVIEPSEELKKAVEQKSNMRRGFDESVAPTNGLKTLKIFYIVDNGTRIAMGGKAAAEDFIRIMHANHVASKRELVDITIDPEPSIHVYENFNNWLDSIWRLNAQVNWKMNSVLSTAWKSPLLKNGYNGNQYAIINATVNGGGLAMRPGIINDLQNGSVSCIYLRQSPNFRQPANQQNIGELWTHRVHMHETGHCEGAPHSHRCNEWLSFDGKPLTMDSCWSDGSCRTPFRKNNTTIMGYWQVCGSSGLYDFGNLPRIRIQQLLAQQDWISGTYLGAPSLTVDSLTSRDNRVTLNITSPAKHNATGWRLFENGVVVESGTMANNSSFSRVITRTRPQGSYRYRAEFFSNLQRHSSDSGTVVVATPAQPTLCTSYVYSAWSPCINGTQMRTATGVPSGCVGVAPELTRSCEMVQVKLPIASYVATGTTHQNNVAARAFDGNSTSNDNRWVTSGATSTMTMNMANRHCKQLRLWTGFFDKGVWGFAIKSVKVIADDVVVGTYPGSLFFQLDLNRNIQSLRLEFTGDSHVRIREIEVWGW